MIYYCSIQLMYTRKSVCRQLESNDGHALLYDLRYRSMNVPVKLVTMTWEAFSGLQVAHAAGRDVSSYGHFTQSHTRTIKFSVLVTLLDITELPHHGRLGSQPDLHPTQRRNKRLVFCEPRL